MSRLLLLNALSVVHPSLREAKGQVMYSLMISMKMLCSLLFIDFSIIEADVSLMYSRYLFCMYWCL